MNIGAFRQQYPKLLLDEHICACLPSFIACLIFQMYDIGVVIVTVLTYYIVSKMAEDGVVFNVDLFVPIGALVLSAVTFPAGPLGLFLWKTTLLWSYLIRICLIVLYSLGWTVYIFATKKKISERIVGGIWASAVVLYVWGIFVTLKAISYLILHYRGYNDVDPGTQEHFDDKMRDLMVEIKEREKGMATSTVKRHKKHRTRPSQTKKTK